MAFEQNVGKAGGKTRKIRPSGGDLCSFRHFTGRSVQDCGKVVQKLAGREDEKYKLCTTLCAPLRLGTRIVQVSFPRCVRCVGVVVRRCAIRSFSLPPAAAGCPFRRRGRGGRQVAAGRTHGRGGLLCEGASAFAFALPHPAHGASPINGRGCGRRQAAAGRTHGQGRGWPCALPPLHTVIRHTSGMVRHCARGHPPLPSPSPPYARRRGTRWHNGADSFPERRGHSPGAADGRTIYYIYACAGARARTFCTGRRATMWITFPWITHCG